VNLQNAVAAVVHDQLGQTLMRVFRGDADANPFVFGGGEDVSLVSQLTGPGTGPPRMSIGFGLDLVGSSLATVLDALPTPDAGRFNLLKGPDLIALRDQVKTALRGKLGLLDNQRDAVARLMAAQDPAALREAAEGLFGGVLDVFKGPSGVGGPAFDSVSRLRQFLGNDVGTALPFATIVNAVQRGLQNAAQIPESVEGGLLAYFFKPDGFKTVDGERVVAPVHLSDVKTAVVDAAESGGLGGLQLRGLFSKTTAERYLRDTIRVIGESAYDAGRGLQGRFDGVASELKSRTSSNKTPEAIGSQFVAWFRGFSSMAESAAMRAVEVGTQGVSEFQTNPLIAASAGSFAGTVARKLAQDSFLGVLRTELDRLPKTP